MKLLFDQNLGFKLCSALAEQSTHARLAALADATDRAVWDYAKSNGLVLVKLDSDFAEMAALFGPPPKVVWLRCGNQPTSTVEGLIRRNAALINGFGLDEPTACLEVY